MLLYAGATETLHMNKRGDYEPRIAINIVLKGTFVVWNLALYILYLL